MLPLKSQCRYDFSPKEFFPQLKLPGNWGSSGHSHPHVSLLCWPVSLVWTLSDQNPSPICPPKSKGVVGPDKDELPRFAEYKREQPSSTAQLLKVWVKFVVGLEPGIAGSNCPVLSLGRVTTTMHHSPTASWQVAHRQSGPRKADQQMYQKSKADF